MNGWKEGWDVCMYVCMYIHTCVCVCVCVCICMHVCMYICKFRTFSDIMETCKRAWLPRFWCSVETANTSTLKLNSVEYPNDCIISFAHNYLFKWTSGITAV